MLQSLKNKGKIGLVGLLLASTLSGCALGGAFRTEPYDPNNKKFTPRKLSPAEEYAIQEAVQSRRKAVYDIQNPMTRNAPLGAEKYPAQKLDTVGEQNPDFKGMPLPDLETWEQRSERMKGRDNQPMGKAPWNVPPGYQNPHTK